MSAGVYTSPTFTPTESLIIDVLVARYRLGDTLWTFETRNLPALRKLEEKALIHTTSGVTENTVRAWLTDTALRDHGTSWFQLGITMDHLLDHQKPGDQLLWTRSHLERLAELPQQQCWTDPRAINTAHVLMIQMISRRHTPHWAKASGDGGVVLERCARPGDFSVQTITVSPDGGSFQLYRDGRTETTTDFTDVLRFTSGWSQ